LTESFDEDVYYVGSRFCSDDAIPSTRIWSDGECSDSLIILRAPSSSDTRSFNVFGIPHIYMQTGGGHFDIDAYENDAETVRLCVESAHLNMDTGQVIVKIKPDYMHTIYTSTAGLTRTIPMPVLTFTSEPLLIF
jgi:hypothetical protein